MLPIIMAGRAAADPMTPAVGNAARGAPSAGFDSIVIPGRKLPSQSGPGGGREMNEEYVIFDGSQAVPLSLLFYEPEDQN